MYLMNVGSGKEHGNMKWEGMVGRERTELSGKTFALDHGDLSSSSYFLGSLIIVVWLYFIFKKSFHIRRTISVIFISVLLQVFSRLAWAIREELASSRKPPNLLCKYSSAMLWTRPISQLNVLFVSFFLCRENFQFTIQYKFIPRWSMMPIVSKSVRLP